jgi:hypothetical protein
MAERERLTTKKAGEIVNDPYTMNGARPEESARGGNGSGDTFQKTYDKGGPAEFGETPIGEAETKALNTKDIKDRNDMNIGEIRLAFANAIKNSQNVREHAAKCVTASECMLPGANDEVVAANAADLMFLPDFAIDGLLARQSSLALAAVEGAGEDDKPVVPPALEEKKADGIPEQFKKEEDKAPAAEGDKPEVKDASEDKIAALEKQVQELMAAIGNMQQAPVAAAPVAPAPAPEIAPEGGEMEISFGDEDPAAAPAPAAKTASSHGDTLESIFNAYEAPASMPSSMVRQASARSEEDELSAVWGSTPNVSSVFG